MENETNGTPTLHQRLAAIRKAIDHVGKDKTNDFHHYNYASAENVARTVKPLLDEYGVNLVPRTLNKESAVVGDTRLVEVELEYHLVNVDDREDREVCAWMGEGMDKGDKALNKAYTAALKYFLIDTFQIPTGEDPEADTSTDRATSGSDARTRAKPRTTSRPAESGQETADASDLLSQTIGGGKHKGKTWRQVCHEEPSYVTDYYLTQKNDWYAKGKVSDAMESALLAECGVTPVTSEGREAVDDVFPGEAEYDEPDLPF